MGAAGDITTQPQYQAAVSTVTAQMTAEGQSSLNIAGAVSALGSTWQNMVDNGISGSDALSAATSYVLGSQTLGGAADIVTGLLGAAASGAPPSALLQMFTGTMVGIMVSAGAVSAGLGAAIVGGVAAVVGLLQAAGLFPGAPSGIQVCPGLTVQTMPSYFVPAPAVYGSNTPACIVAWDSAWDPTHHSGIQPGSANWRKFPVDASGLFQDDAVWYLPITSPLNGGQYFSWRGVKYGSSGSVIPFRNIDLFFPQLHQIECEASAGETMFLAMGLSANEASTLTSFNAAFGAALRLNWAYVLNGITPPASDLQVLVHTIYNWNRAHAPGTGLDIGPSSAAPWQANGTACSGFPPWYAATLAQQAGNVTQPDGVMNGSHLHINTGAKIVFTLANVASAFAHMGSAPASAPSATSTALKYTAGAAVAGLLGAFLYARHKRTTTKAVLGKVWKKTGGTIRMPRLPQHLHLLHIGKR